MQVISHDPYVSETVRVGCKGRVEFVKREELFERSDVLSIHVPLTATTHHAVGQQELALMKSSAIVINTARGPIVDQSALLTALQNRQIAGAGLDVFEQEPVAADNPLLGLDNIILTPHSAALTRECVIRMALEAVKCTLEVFSGRVPPNVANPQVLASDRWKHLVPAVAE
jgi:phosphoglycerate dehydrogenase-like enzyme